MRSKRKIIFFLLLILSSILFFQCCKKTENYSEKIISAFHKQETINVQDIFSFDFHHAYVLDDPYISGEGFAKRHNLDISIEQVESGVSENIGRIVFVDGEGHYVYEFKYDTNKLAVLDEGCIIYPETVIEKVSSENLLTVNFHSSEFIK